MSVGHPPGTLPPPSAMAGRASRYNPNADAPSSYYPQVPSYQAYEASAGPDLHHHRHHHPAGLAPPPPPPPPLTPVPDPRFHGSSGAHGAAGGAGGLEGAAPGLQPSVYVAPPKIEMQPWARNVWRWLVNNTTGVARVDLRRPTPPLPEQYDGNILVVRSRQSVDPKAARGGGRRFGRGRQQEPPVQVVYNTAPGPYGNVYGNMYPAAAPAQHQQQQQMAAAAAAAAGGLGLGAGSLLTGARIKITRSFLIGGGRPDRTYGLGSTPTDTTEEAEAEAEAAGGAARGGKGEGGVAGMLAAARRRGERQRERARRPSLGASWAEKPLLDVGVGFNLDMDQQQVQPVARIKIKDLVSIKAAPLGLLKISRSIPLGPVALKVRYELPLSHANRFWEPPARLMVRLDNAVGSGVHLTAGGIEFDEQVLQFGTAVSLRASAGLAFPRQLPLQEGEPMFRLHVNRLSLKSIW